MIRAGDSLFTVNDTRRVCVLCGNSYGRFNGFNQVEHGRAHGSAHVTEHVRTHDGRLRYEFDLTEAGAVVANKRAVKVAS